MADDFPRPSIEELDADLTAATTMVLGAHWPSTAIACALLDKGIIKKGELLAIIDSLILTASSEAVSAESNADDATFSLERFRRDLEQMRLEPGLVAQELRLVEQGSANEAANYRKMLRDERPQSPDGGT